MFACWDLPFVSWLAAMGGTTSQLLLFYTKLSVTDLVNWIKRKFASFFTFTWTEADEVVTDELAEEWFDGFFLAQWFSRTHCESKHTMIQGW